MDERGWIERAEQAERERDEAQAALVALREAALGVVDGWATSSPHMRFRATLAATPATLADQVRARVLREAANDIEQAWGRVEAIGISIVLDRLRALADKAERTR